MDCTLSTNGGMKLTDSPPQSSSTMPYLPDTDDSDVTPIAKGGRRNLQRRACDSSQNSPVSLYDRKSSSVEIPETSSDMKEASKDLTELLENEQRKDLSLGGRSVGSFSLVSSSTDNSDACSAVISPVELARRHLQSQQDAAMEKRRRAMRRKKKRTRRKPSLHDCFAETSKAMTTTDGILNCTSVHKEEQEKQEEQAEHESSDDDMFSMFDWSVSGRHRRYGRPKPRSSIVSLSELSTTKKPSDGSDYTYAGSVGSSASYVQRDTETLDAHVERARTLWRADSLGAERNDHITLASVSSSKASERIKEPTPKREYHSPNSILEDTSLLTPSLSTYPSQEKTDRSSRTEYSSKERRKSNTKSKQNKAVSEYDFRTQRHRRPKASAA